MLDIGLTLLIGGAVVIIGGCCGIAFAAGRDREDIADGIVMVVVIGALLFIYAFVRMTINAPIPK